MVNYLRKIVKLLTLKVKWSKKLKFDFSCRIDPCSKFEGANKIYSKSVFSGSMGYGSYIGCFSSLNAKIGRFCSISNNVSTNVGVHPFQKPFVSTAPSFFSLAKQNGMTFAKKQVFEEFRYADVEHKYGIIIENDVWICEGVFINPGVRISNGAVILAHAVVTKDVPPYAIVGGVPAKIVGYRYDEDTIDWLMKIQWWNNDVDWFKKNWELMNDIEKLRMHYNARSNMQ